MLASIKLRNKVSYFKLCPKESSGVTSDYLQSPLGSMVGVGGKHGHVFPSMLALIFSFPLGFCVQDLLHAPLLTGYAGSSKIPLLYSNKS